MTQAACPAANSATCSHRARRCCCRAWPTRSPRAWSPTSAFPAAYVTGAGIANTYLGIPDIGLVTVTELADHVAAIRDAFPGPLVVDADTGFGNALNMVRTVQLLERAGADALQIEDQVFPKRCGHFAGKEVIPTAEMVAKVKAAVDTRRDRDLLIIARTDAIAPEGFEAAIERAAAYREAGADVTFVEAPTSMEQIADIPGCCRGRNCSIS